MAMARTEESGSTRQGVAVEVFVTEVLSRDPEIELVSASLPGGERARPQLTEPASWLCVAAGPCW
jgi:hypothetical protein